MSSGGPNTALTLLQFRKWDYAMEGFKKWRFSPATVNLWL